MNTPVIASLLATGNLQSQILGSLLNANSEFDNIFFNAVSNDSLFANTTTSNPLSLLTANVTGTGTVSVIGRNMSLFDPESAYSMMTFINNKDVYYKAQYSELSQMGSSIAHLQDVDRSLEHIDSNSSNEVIKSQLQGFVDEYNNWVQQFNPDIDQGGLLADTQAAKVALYELDQSVENIYNGAYDGMHGLSSLGMTIDPATKFLSLDMNQLDAALISNKQGAVNTIHDFSMNFEKSAGLLNADGNFMPRQLDNLNRVIHYISDNKTSLQEEFGTGDAAKPTGKIALALAAYNKAYEG